MHERQRLSVISFIEPCIELGELLGNISGMGYLLWPLVICLNSEGYILLLYIKDILIFYESSYLHLKLLKTPINCDFILQRLVYVRFIIGMKSIGNIMH